MSSERRRYFRIDETVGISYEIVEHDGQAGHVKSSMRQHDVLDLVAKQDEEIEHLILELMEESPKVAQLVSIFNQKLERIVNQMILESRLVGKIAHRVQEANISACGIAFSSQDNVVANSKIRLELTLYPSKKTIVTDGIVVSCDPAGESWYWRIDFCGMSSHAQEELIQHIVQSQSSQLKTKRN